MLIRDALLPEFDLEAANTRKVLERVPEDKLDWRPHPKSFTMAELATHLADIPGWLPYTLGGDSVDIGDPNGPKPDPPSKSTKELVARFDKQIAAARAALAAAENGVFGQPWSLKAGGKVIFTLPKVAVVRAFVMSHTIHHRGQLTVYLRLNDVPVPSVYGPSADENPF